MAKENTTPLYTKEELTKAENGLLNADQLNYVLKRTPKEHTYSRPAKGGGNWTYVTGAYVKKVLNMLFGWDWDFKVVNFEVNWKAKQAIVHGELRCRIDGKEIIKTQFGRSDIAFKKVPVFEDGKPVMVETKNGVKYQKTESGDEPVDLGNELKAATTDALKKCASELGLFGDVYSPDDYKEIKVLSDNQAKSKDYWRNQISEALELCQDDGYAEAIRKDSLELDEKEDSLIEDYIKIYRRLTKSKK